MNKERAKIFSAFFIFTGLNVLNAGIPFLLLPLLTTYLVPEEYLIIDIFQNISFFIIPLIGLNSLKATDRFYYDRDKIDFSKFVSTSLLFSFFTVIFFLILTFIISFFVNQYILKVFPFYLVYFSLIYVSFSLITETQLSIWRVQVKPFQYGGLRITKTFIDLGISILLIVLFHWAWKGRIIGLVLGSSFAGLIALYSLYKNNWIKPSFSFNYLKQGINFGRPLIIHTLSGFIIGFSDKLFILNMIGDKEAGIYSVAYQIGMVMSLLANSFNQVWAPHTFKVLKAGNRSGFISLMKANYLITLGLALIVPMIVFSLPYIYEFFINKNYQSGINVIVWVLLGYAFNGMYRMFVNYLLYAKKTKIIALNTSIAALLNLILNYFLINQYGVVGAGMATAASFLVLLMITLKSVSDNFSIPWFLK